MDFYITIHRDMRIRESIVREKRPVKVKTLKLRSCCAGYVITDNVVEMQSVTQIRHIRFGENSYECVSEA